MSQDYKFKGWVAKDDKSHQGGLVEEEYEPKRWEETDVDIKVEFCGICGSDVHTLSGGWSNSSYPLIVGHEIVGKAVKVGKDIKHIKVGDRVGVGANSESCLKCDMCTSDREPYCAEEVDTFNGIFKCGDKSYGGYADYSRVPGHFVVNLEDVNLPSHTIAPMMCGGITLYSPLKNNGCGDTAQTVGIIGVGGLGHFGVMFAKALGAKKVVGISRKKEKGDDVLKMGADEYIATDDDKDWEKKYAKTFDLICCTVNSQKMPFQSYLSLLKPFGTFVQLGAPDANENIPPFHAFDLLSGIKLTGSMVGSPRQIKEMLLLAAEKGVKTWANPMPLAKVNDALQSFHDGKPRYRIVLVNEKHAEMPKEDIAKIAS